MEAPDKIYVTIDRPNERIEYNPELVGVAWSKKDKSCEHIEYIRKDLLLEWAKAEIELSKRVECVSEKSYEDGRQRVAQNLIDKLNPL